MNQQNNCDEWQYMYRGSSDCGDLEANIKTSTAVGFIPIIGGLASIASAQNANKKQQFDFVTKVLSVSFDKQGKLITYRIDTDNSQVGGF